MFPAVAQFEFEAFFHRALMLGAIVLLWPFLPTTATKIYAQLGLSSSPDKNTTAAWGGLQAGHAIGEPAALFPRKDKPTP